MNPSDCQCPNPADFKEFIRIVDDAIETLDISCENIAQSKASENEIQLVYSQLKYLDTMFGQMCDMALQCAKANEIAEPLIVKHEKVPIITMVSATRTDFIDYIGGRYPEYYEYLAVKFSKYWDEADKLSQS